MKASVVLIGVLDKAGKTHVVNFNSGVNVVTGRSSTGKSALIEIFDHCLGSSGSTIPEGVITERASIYFCVVRIRETNLVLARRHSKLQRAFLKLEIDDEVAQKADSFPESYFEDDYFLPLADFKKDLGRYFGLRITDVDEDLFARDRRAHRKKLPSPSVRSISSFIFQHQNLVANKHAIFYRFDEKEKREQAIEHLKIFAGLADQTYFIKKQELNQLRADQRRLELGIPRAEKVKERAKSELDSALREYLAISGKDLDIGGSAEASLNPRVALDELRRMSVTVEATSNEHTQQKQIAERERDKLVGSLRRAQQKLADVQSSIRFTKDYAKDTAGTFVPADARLHVSECPFCHSQNSEIENEANKLKDAIHWLNRELVKSRYFLESFEEQERDFERDVERLKKAVEDRDREVEAIDKQIDGLDRYRTQHELAVRSKLRIEAVLENLLERPGRKLEDTLGRTKVAIKKLERFIRDNYDIQKKIDEAEAEVCRYMREIGRRFEFEAAYKPIQLEFSLKTFDLWHKSEGRKIFLRSMGSGANWLYCHLTLFLGLHRYFCRLGDKCSVPSILFLDQPSQVYFPSILDAGESFSPKEIAKKEGRARRRSVDEDVAAVTNLYSELVRFCLNTEEQTGIRPQIIVTDHADNLTLEDGTPFEELVQGRRWRDRGFIDTEEEEQEE